MPSFLKDLRRISSSRKVRDSKQQPLQEQPQSFPNGSSAEVDIPNSEAESSINSTGGSRTPPTSLPSDRSADSKTITDAAASPNGTVNSRPGSRPVYTQKRYSMSSMMSNGTMNGGARPATSPLAPRVISVSDNSWVHQKILLIAGEIGNPDAKPMDGTINIYHGLDNFPVTSWPVCDSHFKALLYLSPGPNKLRLDFVPARSSNGTSTTHSSWTSINYLPLNNAPPVQLVILLAKDSPGTFDAIPQRAQAEGNGLETAIRKFRMSAYLWQAFTGEQMQRNGFARRCFRYEEEWQEGTVSQSDRATGKMRNEAKVHVIRMKQTLKELRDSDVAQQNSRGKRTGDLYGWAGDACRDYFKPKSGQKLYISCLYLDSHWDTKEKLVRAHAALGGANDPIHLAIFGSHALQSYPTCIEEVVPAFSDCTRTDTRFVANDANESGSNWEAANIGIGAHLHETGHMLGCPHQENGVMLRDYVRLNRTFTTREPYSTRTKSPGQRLVTAKDECGWHRLDCLRFRFHPSFRLPTDPPLSADESVQVWTVDNGSVLATAPSGIAFIEIYGEGDDLCRAWIDYTLGGNLESGGSGTGLPKQITLLESELRAKLPADKRQKRLKLELHSAGQGKHVIEDFSKTTGKDMVVKLPNKRDGFKGSLIGGRQFNGQWQKVVFDSAMESTKVMVAVRIHHGGAVDGLELIYEDRSTQLFGKRGGSPKDFQLDTRRSEMIMGFYLRAGAWIDGLQILTTTGRKSEIYGTPDGGSGHTLIPPRGYNIVGLWGTCGQWLDSFGLIISR